MRLFCRFASMARSYRLFLAGWGRRIQNCQTWQVKLAQFIAGAIATLDAEAQRTGGVDKGIGTIGRRELLEQQSGIEGLAVQGAEAAHGPDNIFSGKYMGGRAPYRLARQALGNEFQEPAWHQTGTPQKRLTEFILRKCCAVYNGREQNESAHSRRIDATKPLPLILPLWNTLAPYICKPIIPWKFLNKTIKAAGDHLQLQTAPCPWAETGTATILLMVGNVSYLK